MIKEAICIAAGIVVAVIAIRVIGNVMYEIEIWLNERNH